MFSLIAALFLAAASPQGADTPAPGTAAASLEGDWRLRVLDPDTGRASRHSSFKIEKAADGRVIGAFPDALYGDFRDGAFADDGDGLSLTFKTARGAVGWLLSGEVSGGELSYEAQLRSGRLDGVAKDKTGAIVLRWQARRPNDDGDRGEFLAGRTWRLKIVDQPEDFCRETYEFRDDGTMTSRSGDEVLEKAWRVDTDGYDSTLVTRVLSTNGKPDCQGDTNAAVGNERALPIVFINGGGYAVCGADRGLSCYGIVSRYVAPPPEPATTPKEAAPANVFPRVMTPEEERDAFARRCDKGEGAACYVLSHLQKSGKGGPVDRAAAFSSLAKGCDLGDDKACLVEATVLFHGENVAKDEMAALAIVDDVCERDNPLACLMAGRLRNSLAPDNLNDARLWFRRGCDLGDNTACGDEALIVIKAGDQSERPERLRAMLNAGCEKKPADGHCGPLGDMALAGVGGDRDPDAAYDAYKRGCNLAEKNACFGLAEFITSGLVKGLKKKDAKTYYDFACDQGVEKACKRIGRRIEARTPS